MRPGDRVRRGAPLVRLGRARDHRGRRSRFGRGSTRRVDRREAAAVRHACGRSRPAHWPALTHDRVAALHAKRSATPQELDQATAEPARRRRAARSARCARSPRPHAARDAAQAALQRRRRLRRPTRSLNAPFDGVVAERHVDPGAMATPGTPLLDARGRDRRSGSRSGSTRRAPRRSPSARPSQVSVGETTERPTPGAQASVVEVARLDRRVARLRREDRPARGGRTSDRASSGARDSRGPSRRALTVPSAAVLRRGQLTFVFAVDGGRSREAARRSRPARVADGRVEMLAGVRDGDRVVVDPPRRSPTASASRERQR